MTTLEALNERRIRLGDQVRLMGGMNVPSTPEADTAYRLAYLAWMAAEKEYGDAMRSLSTNELLEIVSK